MRKGQGTEGRAQGARSVNSRNPVGEGRGGGRDRRQKRERPLAPEGPSDASILRKGNH